MAVMYATRDGEIQIGERYLQFRTMPCMKPQYIVEVETLGNSSRGGFGSTDKENK
jgi:dUTP pyrophosphatase